jgi:hypothetical protein
MFGSGNGAHALPHRYPLSTCKTCIRECEPGLTRRLALETRVLDVRAIGGWRVRPLADFPDRYPGTRTDKAGEMSGKTFHRGGRSANFFCVVAWSTPHALEETGDLDYEDCRNRRSG